MKRVALALFALVMAAFAGFIIAMRAKYPPVLDAVRRFSKEEVNPEAMKTAGTPGSYASIVRHVGRTTGQPYETPVEAITSEAGFVIPLPTGERDDWLRNVIAAGTAEIVKDGVVYAADTPEILRYDEAEPHIPTDERPVLKLFKVEQFLSLHSADIERAAEENTQPITK